MINFWAQAKWVIQNKGTAVFTKSVRIISKQIFNYFKKKKIYWSPNSEDAQENGHKPPPVWIPAEILTWVPGLLLSSPADLSCCSCSQQDSKQISSLSSSSTPALSCPAVLPPHLQTGEVGRKPLEGSGSSRQWAGNPCNHSNEAKSWSLHKRKIKSSTGVDWREMHQEMDKVNHVYWRLMLTYSALPWRSPALAEVL